VRRIKYTVALLCQFDGSVGEYTELLTRDYRKMLAVCRAVDDWARNMPVYYKGLKMCDEARERGMRAAIYRLNKETRK
jgi:hypothetical protein